jgi:hypothetical protein
MNSFKWNQQEQFVLVMCLDQSSCQPAKSVHDIYSSDAITRSTAKIDRRKCIYFIDKRYKNHEKFLKVHISIYMFTLMHFMEPQFGVELCLSSQILKKLLLFILQHNPVKCDNCAIIIDRP